MQILHSIILGEGEPLVILHGYFGMADNWKTLGKQFSKKFQVHLLDQRNHGRSFQSDAFSYDLMVEDLKNYLAHHQIERAHLIGHSMGGKAVMKFAVTHPNYVKTLTIVDIGPKYYKPHHHAILKALNAVDFNTIQSRNEIDEVLKPYISEVGVRMFLLKNVYRIKSNKFAYRFNLNSLTKNNPVVGEALPIGTGFDGPTLFLHGEKSDYILPQDHEPIKEQFPKATFSMIENAGHWLHAENPLQFYQRVESFIENN